MKSLQERFEEKVELIPFSTCHWWLGAPNKKGCSSFRIKGAKETVHRIAYKFYKGPIPDGLCVSQTCKNRLCVNPQHLTLRTKDEVRKSGIPTIRKNHSKTLQERFEDKIELIPFSTCHWWIGVEGARGYGVVKVQGEQVSTHRFAYELYKGPIPKDLCVLHHCDNKLCCNPQHLFLGTIADNNRDKCEKDRQTKGEENGDAKLTTEEVLEIRSLRSKGYTCQSIGDMYDICRQHVSSICRKKAWKHLKNKVINQ
ncbi:MAG: hypothetical protein COA71_14610 [SAR86 cluster bacterium]|uniref:HNH nuclease domain-containing protein n=1 Tax=SAR86 cluster bacterium TaxID=2030880 RepID=A0A2A5C6B8_9GAMM|nr:MAG: hypothetical protein COA71_14610 [SAR86 cluster bacterium]